MTWGLKPWNHSSAGKQASNPIYTRQDDENAHAADRSAAMNWVRIKSGRRDLEAGYSAVVGSMMVETRLTTLAGNPPWAACSRTIASFGAL